MTRASVGRTGLFIACALLLSACIATEAPTAVQPTAPGFWLGVWHGFIFPVTFDLFALHRRCRDLRRPQQRHLV